MIQRRWRQQGNNHESDSHDGTYDSDTGAAEDKMNSKKRPKRLQRNDNDTNNYDREDSMTTITTTTSCSHNTTTEDNLSLLFRRNSNFSSISTMISRNYSQLQFISANSGSGDVILLVAVDNYGDLDIIHSRRCDDKLSSLCCEGSTTSSERGATLQADRMSIFASPSSRSSFASQNNHTNHHHENENVMVGGPRQPMANNFHYEIYSYDSDNKLAIGLRGGRVQLFDSLERAAAATSSVVKRNNGRSSVGITNSSSTTTTTARGAILLWSCLPSTSVTIGPQRRYRCNDHYPLSRILSSSNKNTATSASIRERENVLDAYNTFIFEEISDWDRVDDDYFTLRRQRGGSAALNRMILGEGCPWAFREGSSNGGNGMSGTALIGACVDIDNGDCFSLRVIDERCYSTSSPASSSSCCNSTMNVIVVDDYPSKQGNGGGSSWSNERVDSVCFSGEFGLVTSHSITNAVGDNRGELTATSIKVSFVSSLSRLEETVLMRERSCLLACIVL